MNKRVTSNFVDPLHRNIVRAIGSRVAVYLQDLQD